MVPTPDYIGLPRAAVASRWLRTPPPALRYAAAIMLAALALAVRLPLDPPTLMPFITYVPFILLAAAFGGFGPGVLCTFICTLESIFFSLEPLRTLRVTDHRYWLGIAAFVFTGLIASLLFARLRQSGIEQRAACLELAGVQAAAPVMLFVLDQQLRVRKANDLAVQFAGHTPQEVLGFEPGMLFGCLNALSVPGGCGHSPNCAACLIRTSILDTLRHGTPHKDVEAWLPVAGTGEPRRCLQISSVPIQPDRTSVLVCAQDVTARKLAEIAVLEQRNALKRQAALIDLSHDAIITADPQRVITAWNTGAQKLYGWTEAEAVGKTLPAFLRTGDAILAVDETLRRDGHWQGELQHSCRDGTLLTLDSRQVLQRDAEGNPQGILEINRDITAQKNALAALQQAHSRTISILENISDGFASVDRDFRYTYVNPAAARMLGMPSEDLLGRCLWDVWPYAASLPFGAAMRRSAAENVPLHVEGFYPEPLNAWFDFNCYPSPEGLSQFFTDITERKRADGEIRRLNAELEQRVHQRTAQLETANRELETFAYSVSHDLRAPLRGIDGWSLALLEDFGPKLDDEARHYLGRVRSEAQRMGELIDALLRLSRVTRAPLQYETVDLSAMAHAIAGDLQERHAERHIDFTIEPGLSVQGDSRLLEVALTNLLGNAVKFTARQTVAHIALGRAAPSGRPAIYVQDNGAGFDMAYARSLFGPFQRLHRSSEFPGTGIGLATVQRIVHRHGGSVWAEAEVNRGATFYFTLGN